MRARRAEVQSAGAQRAGAQRSRPKGQRHKGRCKGRGPEPRGTKERADAWVSERGVGMRTGRVPVTRLRRREGCGGPHFLGNMSVFGKTPSQNVRRCCFIFSFFLALLFNLFAFSFSKIVKTPQKNVYFPKICDCLCVRVWKSFLQNV